VESSTALTVLVTCLLVAWIHFDSCVTSKRICRQFGAQTGAWNSCQLIEHHVCGSDGGEAKGAGAADRFNEAVSQRSCCLFAKTAKVWGSDEWDFSISLERNVEKSIPRLIKFLSDDCTLQKVDAFVFEVRGRQFSATMDAFADTVRRVLSTVAEHDPTGRNCMERFRGHLGGKSGWYFEFSDQPLFITTFADLYGDEGHSRSCCSPDGESCYILLQPEMSFLLKGLDSDTPHTNWDDPKTIRDHIRVAHRRAGRDYVIPPSVSYPPAEHIVKALEMNGDIVRWWSGHD